MAEKGSLISVARTGFGCPPLGLATDPMADHQSIVRLRRGSKNVSHFGFQNRHLNNSLLLMMVMRNAAELRKIRFITTWRLDFG